MNEQGTAWISEGLEVLIAELAEKPNPRDTLDFDAVIVGSGYGGAIAASRLAGATDINGKPLKICLLERGQEYLPGMFPAGFSSLAGHVRISSPWEKKVAGQRHGLFDIRIAEDINALVANGLGGGSLINAGVMEVPTPQTFDKRWPQSLRGGHALTPYYRMLKSELGASRNGDDNTIARHPETQAQPLAKHRALKKLASNDPFGHFRDAAITVAMDDLQNHAGVSMNRCTLCGDCATGCNFGAKESLDLNLLVRARRAELRIFTGATVLYLLQDGEDWLVETVYTQSHLAEKAGGPTRIRARKVILSAGALGSTEILLRTHKKGLPLASDNIGKQFSGNGDMIAVGYGMNDKINAVANESTPYEDRRIGPTITGVIDRRHHHNHHPVVIEEMAVPGAMRRIFEEIYTTTNCLRNLASMDWTTHRYGNPAPDPFSVNEDAIANSQVYAVIGDDGANGQLCLRENFDYESDGGLAMNWNGLRDNALFPSQIKQLETLTWSSQSGGEVIPNPLWQTFPASMNFLLDNQNGPLLTVHPLGGCAMGDSSKSGVVDEYGRVYTGASGQSSEVYPGLAVIDGAMIPCAVGTNPALTIAAVSARATEGLLKDWKWKPAAPEAPINFLARPRFSEPPQPELITPTRMQFAERLRGWATLDLEGSPQPYMVELTLFFKDKALHELTAPEDPGGSKHSLEVTAQHGPSHKVSQLRLFSARDWNEIENEYLSGQLLEERLQEASLLTAPLEGTLRIMAREESGVLRRMARSIWAYLLNRGLRDTWQAVFKLRHEREATANTGSLLSRFKRFLGSVGMGLMYSSRAGEIRLFEYELSLGTPSRAASTIPAVEGKRIAGAKHISYRRRGNPLRQLMEITLSSFPGLVSDSQNEARLELRPEFLARKGLPLFRITRQHDMPQAVADVLSLATYFLRLLASTHLLSARAPDLPPERVDQQLPGPLPGLPPPQAHFACVDELPPGADCSHRGRLRLTHYPNPSSRKPPVMTIHGYSASGTTFAHPEVQPNLASHLWEAGHDVWVLDMRSSCGMPTARENYSFEELAYSDIPLAVQYVCDSTGAAKIDVVAHCMGSAMFAMAVLNADRPPQGTPYREQLAELPGRINRLVMSQVGPLVSMAPANVFRAYAFSYLKHFLPLEIYQFKPAGKPGQISAFDAALDRLLSVLPYDDQEFDLENPLLPWKRTSFTRTRHRMDLLYGRTFSLKNLSPAVLEHIDDLFGPLSVDTATQVLHFARYQTITNHAGDNDFVSREQLDRNWSFPSISLHGRDNGLADVATIGRLERILKEDAHRDWRKAVFQGFGHQDSLIGSGAREVFETITAFLDQPLNGGSSQPRDELFLQAPWSGPVMGPVSRSEDGSYLPLSFGVNPALSRPRGLVALPLKQVNEALELCLDGGGMPTFTLQAIPDEETVAEQAGIRWTKLMLKLEPTWPEVHSLLLLLVYDESPQLDNAVFGKGSRNINAVKMPSTLNLQVEQLSPDCLQCVDHLLSGRGQALVTGIRQRLEGEPTALEPGIVKLPRYRASEALCFAVASCQFPPGILDEKPAFEGYSRLAGRLENPGDAASPELLLLLGDQVYVDSTAGVFDPSAKQEDERFQQPYRRWYRSKAARRVLRKVPAYMMLDDHEIIDNWENLPHEPDNQLHLALGRKYFRLFQRGPQQEPGPGLWYELEENGFHFFVADSRSERPRRQAGTVGSANMLGERQCRDLEAWLRRVANSDPQRPKFLACPAMPFPRLRKAQQWGARPAAIQSDSWDGYPATLEWLLKLIAELRIRNLVMLNGDAHLSCIARINLQYGGEDLRFWSVHSSALYAPLPFANARREELMGEEQFQLDDGRLKVDVSTEYAPAGDGFAILELGRQEDGEWQLSVSFDREPVASDPAWQRQILPPSGYAPPEP